jgi:hypothetical protein
MWNGLEAEESGEESDDEEYKPWTGLVEEDEADEDVDDDATMAEQVRRLSRQAVKPLQNCQCREGAVLGTCLNLPMDQATTVCRALHGAQVFHCYLFNHEVCFILHEPRGTNSFQLPSAVISTVDHLLGSPSLIIFLFCVSYIVIA